MRFVHILATGLQQIITSISKTSRYRRHKRRVLKPIMLDCHFSIVNFLFDLSSHLAQNKLSVTNSNNGEISQIFLDFHEECLFFFLPDLYQTINISTNYPKNPRILNFTSTCPVGVALFNVDGWWDGYYEADSRLKQLLRKSA